MRVRLLAGIAILTFLGCMETGGAKLKTKNEPGPKDADAPAEFTATASGLKYRILRKSEGPKPTAQNTVTAHYKGWLDDGTVFDSSYTKGKPITFPLRRFVPGWAEGMQLVGKGGMIELEIPGKLAYADRPPPGSGIPPNATLHFVVELLDIPN